MKKRFVWGAAALVLAIVLPSGVSVFGGYQEYLAATSPFVLSDEQKAEIAETVARNGNPVGVLCTGVRLESYSNLENLRLRSEAKAVCDYVSELVPGVVTWVNSKFTDAEELAGKVEISVRNKVLPETFVPAVIEVCKLRDQRIIWRQPNNVGFPLQRDVIPVIGQANFLVVPVSFSDASPEPALLPWVRQQGERLVEWYEYFSQGELSVNVQYLDSWVELNVPSTNYSSNKGAMDGTLPQADIDRNFRERELTQQVVRRIGAAADFTNLHAMILVFPEAAKGITTSILQRGVSISTPNGRQSVVVWGSGRELAGDRDQEWALYVHEFLHSQGLALHAPGNGSDFGVGQNTRSIVLSGWEQFRLGWLKDNQIVCLDAKDMTESNQVVNLTALEKADGQQKLLIIRLSATQAIVVESRRPIGYSDRFTELSGLVAYWVDVTRDNDRSRESSGDGGNDPAIDKWAYLLAPEGTYNPETSTRDSEKFIFQVGDTASYGGIRIQLAASEELDSIRIRKSE